MLLYQDLIITPLPLFDVLKVLKVNDRYKLQISHFRFEANSISTMGFRLVLIRANYKSNANNLFTNNEFIYSFLKIQERSFMFWVFFWGGGLCIFCPGTMTTHADSTTSDLQRGLDRCLRHTTLNTEQNQLAIKVSADN